MHGLKSPTEKRLWRGVLAQFSYHVKMRVRFIGLTSDAVREFSDAVEYSVGWGRTRRMQ